MKHPNELDNQLENLRTLQQSYDQIAGAAEAYNVGKTQLAAAITSKGVETSPTESYPEMAEKVAQIPQETTIYEGADSYGKQIGAGGSLWDLYQVLADMKTRFVGTGDYAALIVCEYYKGYDSLQLQGADGYYTCDGDYYDYAHPNHVWHDDDNGKVNRWVAFLYRNEGARLDITNTSISPRSMYIGGHIGTIEYFTNGRLTDLVCGIEDTDILDNFITTGYTQAWNNQQLNLIANRLNLSPIGSGVFLKLKASVLGNVVGYTTIQSKCQYAYIDLGDANINIGESTGVYFFDCNTQNVNAPLCGFVLKCNRISCDNRVYRGILSGYNGAGGGSYNLNNLCFIYLDCELASYSSGYSAGIINDIQGTQNLSDVYIGSVNCSVGFGTWNPTNILADADKKAQLIENIKNHILARVSDATGGTQLVFTISTNMYNNIASEQIEWNGETMSLADAFLTKNWLLAGA